MRQNIGGIDMAVRLAIAAVLFYIGFFDNPIVSEGNSKLIIGIVGFVPLLTALFRFCPLYAVIGMSTRGDGDTD